MDQVLEPIIDIPVIKPSLPMGSELESVQPKKSKRQSAKQKTAPKPTIIDRPKWIPDHILENWDPDPYAYQTEEDLMPAGGPHGATLGDVWGRTNENLRAKELMLLMDVFMLYRDDDNRRNRAAPDLLIVPSPEGAALPSAYDLETDPTPICAFEVVSPSSKVKDEDSPHFYIEQLGIPSCVIVTQVDKDGKQLERARLAVWQQDFDSGLAVESQPNSEGEYWLPQINMWVGTEEQDIYFVDGETGEVLRTAQDEREARKAAEVEVEIAQGRAESAEERAESAEERAASAEAEVANLQAIRLQEKRQTLQLILDQKFADMPDSIISQIEQTDDFEKLEAWFLQSLTTDSWQGIFSEHILRGKIES